MSAQLKNLSIDHNLTAIDILPQPKGFTGTYVVGDATNMPFEDNTFDTVISTDVLEHIPPDKKDDFVKECIRVAKSYIIIAAPFDTEGVDEAERATDDFNRALFGASQQWLEEHFANGKPNLKRVQAIAKRQAVAVETVGTNNLLTWVVSTHVNLIEAKQGLDQSAHKKLNKKLNVNLLETADMIGPYYRHFVIIFKQKPSDALLAKLKALAKPKINYAPTIEYIHGLMGLIKDRIQSTEQTLAETHGENEKLRIELDKAYKVINNQAQLIEKCRPYLRALKLNPKRLVKKLGDTK
jgi:hypothetical protein